MARFDTGHGNLEDVRGDRPLWNNGSFGFIIVAFPTSTFWSPMVYNMVHGVTSACKHVCDVRHLKGNGNGRLYIY